MIFKGKNNDTIEVIDLNPENMYTLTNTKNSELSLLWFKSPNNKVTIDSIEYAIDKNELISFTEFHSINAASIESVVLVRWNRAFYCVVDHDSEVGCKGILYYGASKIPIIKPDNKDLEVLTIVFKMLLLEMQSKDSLQLEMLQMMLKRLLILCTRIYKNTYLGNDVSVKNKDIIREYNFFVEQHFKTKHTVKEYADLVYKSPKTLSNIFKKHGNVTPLKYIHNRIILEARRLILYTDKSVSDISYLLGFSDVQSFSRFFKKLEGISPQNFRKRELLTTSNVI